MNQVNRPTFVQNNYKTNSKFNGGSRLVLGTAALGGVWGKVDERKSIEAVLYALERGVEAIDTAPSYNKAQQYVGMALAKWSGETPFISTKIGRLQAEKADEIYLDYSRDGMWNSMEESLNLLGVDYVDLLFLHEPHLVPIQNIDSILDTLRSFQDQGIVGMIGIGGNPEGNFWPYVKRENFDVVSSFLKIDACSLEGFSHDIPKYQKEGLAIYAASSLHMGLLGARFEKYLEEPPRNEWIQRTHIENAVHVKKIAGKSNMSLSELALRYLFSMEEADRIVLGPKNIDEVEKSLNSWEKGPLRKEIFDEVTQILLMSLNKNEDHHFTGTGKI